VTDKFGRAEPSLIHRSGAQIMNRCTLLGLVAGVSVMGVFAGPSCGSDPTAEAIPADHTDAGADALASPDVSSERLDGGAPDGKVVQSLEIGTFGALGWFSPIPETNDPHLTWEVIALPNNPRFGVTTVWEDQREAWSTGKVPQTDFVWVQKQFDKAAANIGGNWTYATYLLGEELFHPSVRAQWVPSAEGLSSWDIEGSATFAGVDIMHLKPWYIQKHGAWDQAWWDSAKAANHYDDQDVLGWSVYYGYNMHKAWNQHMKSLGKKSAETGIVGIPAAGPSGLSQSIAWLYPSPMWEYVMANVDAVLAYQYPTCIACAYANGQRPVSASVDVVKRLREDHGYSGKIIQIITSVWPGGTGSGDPAVQWAEFQAVAPYVDVIMGPVYVFNNNGPNPSVPYAPRLVQFLEDYQSGTGP
jgi:hypothetical protein